MYTFRALGSRHVFWISASPNLSIIIPSTSPHTLSNLQLIRVRPRPSRRRRRRRAGTWVGVHAIAPGRCVIIKTVLNAIVRVYGAYRNNYSNNNYDARNNRPFKQRSAARGIFILNIPLGVLMIKHICWIIVYKTYR